jgi:hypothetical protein
MKNYAGLVRNNLTAISFVKRENKITYWLFLCKCGNKKTLNVNKVFSKKATTKACGCLKYNYTTEKENINSIFMYLYRSYRKTAKARNYTFNISLEFFSEIILKKCFYCGSEPERIEKGDNKKSFIICNGIDRKHNNIGYEPDNCVPCCTICNYAKRSLSFDYFMNWIDRLKKS